MSRPTVYSVPTDDWYIEHAVWLIAGVVLLVSTALAAIVDPRFIVFVAITGITSVRVAFTGFCPVANILQRFGLRGRLADPSRPDLYVMKTDSWYLERRIYGTVGVAMVWFAGTGFCILANYLYWIGCEPRLAPQYAHRPRTVHEFHTSK